MFRRFDPEMSSLTWLAAFEDGLSPDSADAETLWWIRCRVFEYFHEYARALEAADQRILDLQADESPRGIRERKIMQRFKEKLLETMGASETEVEAVNKAFQEIPARPAELDPRMIDLSDFYTQNLFQESLELGRLAETFHPQFR